MLVKWLKEHWKRCIFFGFVFVILVPLLINILFKIQSPIDFVVAEWDASAALAFYGALLGAGITVYGVYLTIQYSRENYREDVRNRVLPFIVIDMLKTKSHKNIFSTNEIDNEPEFEGYIEYKLEDYYCILKDGKIEYRNALTKEQKQLIENGGTRWVPNGNGGSYVVVDEICVPLEFENIGNGTAVNFRCGINRRDVPIDDRRFLPVIAFRVGGKLMMHIFSEDCGRDSKNLGEYILSFVYEDIYKNKYEQSFDISIEYNEEHHAPMFSINMDHAQELLK
nr:hypothetical protein [uncultured Butyrivibrio sp.]